MWCVHACRVPPLERLRLVAVHTAVRSTMKCTEPVAPSSGFPTDRRRSGCRSENHQPRVLRTRCMADTRGTRGVRQGAPGLSVRKLRFFLFAQGPTAYRSGCSISERKERRAERKGSTQRSSPSRERFRPPSRRTFRFRVVLLGGLRPTGAPCSAQAETYDTGPVRSRGSGAQSSRNLR
jgi:hypothetical protein